MAQACGQGGAWGKWRWAESCTPLELRGRAGALQRPAMLGGKPVTLLGSLRREGKGEAGFAQTKGGSPLAFLVLPPIRSLYWGHRGCPILLWVGFQPRHGTALQQGDSADVSSGLGCTRTS